MSGRAKGILAVLAVAVGLLAGLPASASAATFTVNDVGDQSDNDLNDGICDRDPGTSGKQCTLRAAVEQANFAAGSRDTITFGSALTGNTIFPSSEFDVDTPMVIDGGDCGDETIAHQPCVRVDNPSLGAIAFIVMGDDVSIRGLAVTGVASFPAIAVQEGANRFKLRNSWLGLDLDQNAEGSAVGVQLEGNGAMIGGTTGADRNVFAYNSGGHINIQQGSENKVRGNYFGTEADGTTPAGSPVPGIEIDADREGTGVENPSDTVGTVIGASVSSSAVSTTKCDGGCNVISNSSIGVFDRGDGTTVKGNFIGLDKTGAGLPNTSSGVDERGIGATIGGETSAERNFIAGMGSGVFKFFGTDMSVKRNFIGLNSAGTAVATGSSLDTGIHIGAGGLAARNRIAGCVTGINMENAGGRAVRNKIGLDKNGDDLPGASITGIRVSQADNIVGEPGAGNTIGNSGTGILINAGDRNVAQANYIGVGAAGAAHPNTGVGILVQSSGATSPDDNEIGGTTGASENVISNSGSDAIRISAGSGMPSGNEIRRNRGKANGSTNNDLFIDLEGTDGFGNGNVNLHSNIEAPTIEDTLPGDATRTHAEGVDAQPNATIYIFRTSAAATFSPNRINAFVDTAVANGSGDWSANFPQIPTGQRLTALQLDPTDGSSELALAIAP
jgi:hypothetical protein